MKAFSLASSLLSNDSLPVSSATRPDAKLVIKIPTKFLKEIPWYALRGWVGCVGDGGLSATASAYQPLSKVWNLVSSELSHTQSAAHHVLDDPSCGSQDLCCIQWCDP